MSWETDPKDRLVYLNNLVTAAGITPSPDELAIVAQLAKGMGRIGTIGPGIVSPVFVALLCSNPKVVGGQGLCFDGLTFDVPLDISGAAPAWPLVFKNCTFDKGIRMARAVLRSIRLENSTVHNGLDGDRLKVEGSFEALDCQIHGGLILLGADIGGVLNLSGCILNNPHEFALRATGCRVGGTVYCRLNKASGNRFIASGAVRFRYAEIGGNFHFAGASLSWGDMPAGEVASRLPGDTGKVAGVALDAEGMKIGGHVLLRMTIPAKGKDSISFFANGRVGISSSEIAGQLVCSGAFMRSATPSAEEDKEAGTLWADCIRVGRSVYLDKGFHSIGEVSLDAAEIGGRLDCSAAKFESRVKNRKIARVLSVRGATIARSVLLCHGFFSEGGRVELTRSRIGGHLHAHWARFSNPDHDVLDLSQAKITGMVRLGLPANDRPESPSRNLERQCYIGSVRMAGAHIGDNLECENGLFMLNEARTASDPAKKVLWAARAIVHGHVHLLADVQCPSCGIYGQMGFRGAVVHGNFHMRRMTVEVNSNGAHQGHPNQEPDPYPDEKPRSYVDERPNVAITLIRADIRGSAFMEECRFKGEMRMHAMRIGGLFSLVGTEVDAAAGPHPPYLAIAANGIRIEGELFMQRGFKALGEVRLFGAQVGGRILCHSARL
ncbi:MAG: hypothetical protein HY055_13620, partial [Magnetospirillum sp.]|nr:hypothetical protein [Magnetospirillum sp.]